MLNCQKCGKEFKNAHGLKIHDTIRHGKGRKARAAKKANRPAKTGKGAFVCKTCGRRFKLALHLGRHASVAHSRKRKARKVGRPAGRPAAALAAPAGVDIRSLAIDLLLALKEQVDVRLADIARRMRAARIRI